MLKPTTLQKDNNQPWEVSKYLFLLSKSFPGFVFLLASCANTKVEILRNFPEPYKVPLLIYLIVSVQCSLKSFFKLWCLNQEALSQPMSNEIIRISTNICKVILTSYFILFYFLFEYSWHNVTLVSGIQQSVSTSLYLMLLTFYFKMCLSASQRIAMGYVKWGVRYFKICIYVYILHMYIYYIYKYFVYL